ncbi:MORN repeat protein [compost metagenome]
MYEGQFLNDDRSGYGISYYDNGKKEYEGSFAYNNRHGIGTLYDYLGNVIYKGEFRDGLTLTQYKERYP